MKQDGVVIMEAARLEVHLVGALDPTQAFRVLAAGGPGRAQPPQLDSWADSDWCPVHLWVGPGPAQPVPRPV